jgi:hypothetical protein
VVGDRLRIEDSLGVEEIDLGAQPTARQFVNQLLVLFRGDLEALRRDYEVVFEGGAESWLLRLTSRSARVRQLIREVTLRGRADHLDEMIVSGADGETTRTTYQRVATDRPFRDDELARLFPGAGASAKSDGSPTQDPPRTLFSASVLAMIAYCATHMRIVMTCRTSCRARAGPSCRRSRGLTNSESTRRCAQHRRPSRSGGSARTAWSTRCATRRLRGCAGRQRAAARDLYALTSRAGTISLERPGAELPGPSTTRACESARRLRAELMRPGSCWSPASPAKIRCRVPGAASA